MGEKALKIDAVEREVAALLAARVDELGWTPAQLARESGVNRSRVYTMLASESPIGVSTLADMCRVLGLRASDVVREAEAAVAAREREAARAAEADRIEAALRAGVDPMSLGLAASRGRGSRAEAVERLGFSDDLGEEDQTTPGDEPA